MQILNQKSLGESYENKTNYNINVTYSKYITD